jgi:hypothetical protein
MHEPQDQSLKMMPRKKGLHIWQSGRMPLELVKSSISLVTHRFSLGMAWNAQLQAYLMRLVRVAVFTA